MTDNSSPSSAAGGCLLALCVVSGAIMGVVFHQISAGIVIGAAVGALIAVAVWLKDQDRHRQ